MSYQPNLIEGFCGLGWDAAWVSVDGELLDPAESLKIRNHSPTGFAWGYGGSGPSQLALAILLRVLGYRNVTTAWPGGDAERLYMDFKWTFVAKFPTPSFRAELDVDEWAAYQYETLEAKAY